MNNLTSVRINSSLTNLGTLELTLDDAKGRFKEAFEWLNE